LKICYNRDMSTEPKNAGTVAEGAAAYSAKAQEWNEAAAFESIFRSLSRQGLGACAARLAYLHSTEDMEDDDAPLSLESARGFVEFMNGFPDLGEPLLGLFAGGTLSAGWRIADDKHLLVEPLDGKNAAFALIGPSRLPGEVFRANGNGTIAEVIHALRKHGVDKWSSA